jgi:hypothetical protein
MNGFLLFLNILGFLGTIIINGLANTLPLNNKTTGELADQYPNLFVPAGITFSIWGLIYLLLAVFVIYHIIASIKNKKEWLIPFKKIGIFFFISCILNSAWIFVWHYELVSLSMIIMLLLLWTLLVIYSQLNIGKLGPLKKERYLVHLPFSIYLGWISVATIANAAVFLVHIKWDRFGLTREFWTVAVIIVVIIISLLMLFQKKDIFYNFVIAWALLGILLKRWADPAISAEYIIDTAITGLALISVGILIQIIRRKVY